MSSKMLISVVAVAFLVTQVLPQSQGVPLNSPQQQQQSPQHPLAQGGGLSGSRKINLLNPGIIKLYRLLGGQVALDEDGTATGDESYFQKRQQYDDYGHMRFGKRNPKDFDDYGHMRFGKK